MIELYGYETELQQRTFDCYNDIDCFHYSGLHDYIKYLKYGYGKVSDHASREIRFGRLTREEGVDLVKNHIERTPKDIDLFLNWINIDKSAFQFLIDPHRNNLIWERDYKTWEWILKDCIVNHVSDEGVDSVRLPKLGSCDFQLTKSKKPNYIDDKYILIGKGVVS